MVLKIPPPLQGLIAGFLIWLCAVALPGATVQFPGQQSIAIIIAMFGLGIDFTALIAFIKAKTTINPLAPETTNQLVISGLYRYSRNPMYVGMLLLLLSWTLWLGTPLGLLPVIGFILSINKLQIIPEEQALETKFGDAYRTYKQQVRRWI